MLDAHLEQIGTGYAHAYKRRSGLRMLLDWLEQAEGGTWQQRWAALGEDLEVDWQSAAGAENGTERQGLALALKTLMSHRIIRPSYERLAQLHNVSEELRRTTDHDDFARVIDVARRSETTGHAVSGALTVLGRVLIHTGKRMDKLTTEDLLDYAASVRARGAVTAGLYTAHELLCTMGIIEGRMMIRGQAMRRGRLSVEDMVGRRGIACDEVRELLIRYLREREPALDYSSLKQLENHLVNLFWRDIERHHPGVDSLRLPPPVASAWKKRARVLPSGEVRATALGLFTSVRCLYADIAQWAVEQPEVWGPHACPSPISEADLRGLRKGVHQRAARMQARTRSLATLLPVFADAVRRDHEFARGLLEAAITCPPGETFMYAGNRYERVASTLTRRKRELGAESVRVRRAGEQETTVIRCQWEEEETFWAHAVVEILRLTGIRLEEILELTHLSVREHRMPDGQTVMLLQIAPSKMDRERVLPVCPELAHVLAAVVARVQASGDHVPLVGRYDPYEKVMGPPLPYLLQRIPSNGGQRVLMGKEGVPRLLRRAAERANLRDVDGRPIRFTAHDFRRLFATEAVNGGLPIHIAAKLLGHLDLNTTRGYLAVYPEEVVRHFQAHLARRRAVRPGEEYREPTEAEWKEFETHFRHRKMALGDCYRPYGTDCPHEHACVRCPMLRMDPDQLPRLLQIEQNTHDLLSEAKEKGWEGEAAGLEETLLHIGEKKAQVDRIRCLPVVQFTGRS